MRNLVLILIFGVTSAVCSSGRAEPVSELRTLMERCRKAWSQAEPITVMPAGAKHFFKRMHDASGFDFDVTNSNSLIAPYHGTISIVVKRVSEMYPSREEAEKAVLDINSGYTISNYVLKFEYRESHWVSVGAVERMTFAFNFVGPRGELAFREHNRDTVFRWSGAWAECRFE